MKNIDTLLESKLKHYRNYGTYSLACCPFHKDDSPSLGIKSGYFRCFGCGKAGKLVWLIRRLAGSDDDVNDLILESLITDDQEIRDLSMISVMSTGLPLDFETYKPGMIHPLLLNRIQSKTVAKFDIGSSILNSSYFVIPVKYDDYVSYAMRHMIKQPELGVMRWLFPKNFTKTIYPKVTSDELILAEGLFSMMRIHERGYKCSCIFGNSITSLQLEMLVMMKVKKVVVCFDSDEKGFSDSVINLAKRISHMFEVFIIILPEGDPEDVTDNQFDAAYEKMIPYEDIVSERERQDFYAVINYV